MKNLELQSLGLIELDAKENMEMEGGRTDFAYDVGTFIRCLVQVNNRNLGGAAWSYAVWCVQQ
jgi:hypothetical protein